MLNVLKWIHAKDDLIHDTQKYMHVMWKLVFRLPVVFFYCLDIWARLYFDLILMKVKLTILN